MGSKLMCFCAMLALGAACASAQMKQTFSGKCPKAEVTRSIPAGDREGHAFMIQQGKCDITTAEVKGAKAEQGVYAEQDETTATRLKGSGVYVVTFDNGDKIFYSYQTTGRTKDGAYVSGSNRYRITGGTGKMKGIKGSGGCKLTGNADGSTGYACSGDYTIAARAATKK